MIAAVLDTNIVISGVGWRGSAPSEVLDELVRGTFVPVTSPVLLAELRRVLDDPKLREAVRGSEDLLTLIEQTSVVVDPPFQLAVLDDESDNRLLEAALAAGADFLVTGDRELLALGSFEGTGIVTAREFLKELG